MQTGLIASNANPLSFPSDTPVQKQYMITRRFNVVITTSLSELSKGNGTHIWVPGSGKIDKVFGISGICQGGSDENMSAHMLQNAILHKVTVLEQKNEFPVNLGIQINLIPNDEVTGNGEQYVITSFCNTHNTQECNVFCADTDSTESAQWRSEYPNYNSSNLETQGVLHVHNQPYVFVHQDHPVIQVLRINRDLINADIDQQTKIDNEWFKVMKTVFNTCCAELRQRVLNKVSARDLNQYSVQIHRLGKSINGMQEDENDIYKSLSQDVLVRGEVQEIEKHINVLMTRRFSYCARLEIQYEVHA